ncbi:MAG TPA: helix-turn-helix domain-containing protein [Pseudonocardiaceae bacterium]|nr:helix-turn-helix domain-containing protein [Pseudonocardiaceae bacterium]
MRKFEATFEYQAFERASPGGPRQIPDRIRARILALSRTTPPSSLGISHWSSPEMARYIKKTEGVYDASAHLSAETKKWLAK